MADTMMPCPSLPVGDEGFDEHEMEVEFEMSRGPGFSGWSIYTGACNVCGYEFTQRDLDRIADTLNEMREP